MVLKFHFSFLSGDLWGSGQLSSAAALWARIISRSRLQPLCLGKQGGEKTHTGDPVLFIGAVLLFLQRQECGDLCLVVGTMYTVFQFPGVKRGVMSLS